MDSDSKRINCFKTDYTGGNCDRYIIEEVRFTVSNDLLDLLIVNKASSTYNLITELLKSNDYSNYLIAKAIIDNKNG